MIEPLLLMWLSGGLFLGWGLGANDASNVFGTAVATRSVKWIHAAVLIAVFVVIGAVLEGAPGMATVGGIAELNKPAAFVATFSAAMVVAFMTYAGLPVSTSQAVMGGLIGVGLMVGFADGVAARLIKVGICWVTNPILPAILALAFYHLLAPLFNKYVRSVFAQDSLLKWGLILTGIYGAYALGANNVANVTGAFTGEGNVFGTDLRLAALVGSVAIAIGALTFSKRVMMTVGEGLVPLEPFTAFVAVLAEALTVHIFAFVGVPVSTSVAIVGGVLGVGIAKGMNTVNRKVLWRIVSGWITTPLIAGVVAFIVINIFRLAGINIYLI